MKSNFITYRVIVFVTLLGGTITFAATDHTSVTVAMIIDTSPNQSKVKLLTAVKNIYKSLEPGDRVLVFSARGNTTSLYASTTKTVNPDDYRDFSAIIDKIRYDWVLHANISKALADPVFKHLVKRTSKSPVIIMVITESEIATSQAKEICRLADLFKTKYGWPLIMTGTASGTNRQLLAASIQDRLYWCALAEAIDSVTLKKHISAARSFAAALYLKTTSKKTINNSKKVLSKNLKPLPVKKKPEITSKPFPTRSERAMPPKKIHIPTKPVEVVSLPIKKKSVQPPKVTDSLNNDEKKKTAFTPPENPVDKKLPFKFTGWLRNPYILAAGIGGLVVTSIVCFVVVSWLKAQDFAKKLVAPVASQEKTIRPKVLVVKVNGTIHRIGNIRRITRFHVGRDPSNTVVVKANKVAPKHLRIFRRGDQLFIKNLAGNPVVVNGATLKSRRKILLSIPAIVEISDGTQIQFLWDKQAKNSVFGD